MRKPDPRIRERNQQIAAEREQGETLSALAEKHGLCLDSVVRICKMAGAKPQAPRPPVVIGPRSTLHQQIGVRLSGHREFNRRVTLTDAALEMSMSSARLREIELGQRDLLLEELKVIAKFIGVPLPELVTERNLTRGSEGWKSSTTASSGTLP